MSITAAPSLDYTRLQSPTRLAERLGEFFVIALICLSFTTPPLPSPQAPLWWKLEQLLIPLVVAVYGWLLLSGRARPIRFNGMFVAGALFCVSILISIWYGSIAFHQPIIFRDIYELPKAMLPVVFYTMAYEAELSEASIRRLVKIYGLPVLFVCLYAWAQWAGLGFTNTLNQYYSAGVHDDVLVSSRRVYATTGNPNLLGELVTWTMAAFILAAMHEVGNRAWNTIMAFACLITLAMTASRYGLLNGCLTFGLAYVFRPRTSRRRSIHPGAVFLLVLTVVAVFAVVANSNRVTSERFQTLRNPLQVDSLQGRLATSWHDAARDIQQSPLFGRGPAKTTYTGVITDSEYLEILKLYGVTGFLCYFAYFLFPLSKMAGGLQAARRAGPLLEDRMPATVMALRLSAIMVLTAMVMNVGMATFYSATVQGFLWMWMGIGARCAMSIRQASQASVPNAASLRLS